MRLNRIKKWKNMIMGKGTLHVKKSEGHNWSDSEVRGFYIDYSGKLCTKQFTAEGIPYTKLETGKNAIIPITVIQYGLGCYEKVIDGIVEYRDGFYRCADYLIDTQAPNGSWEAFAAQRKDNTKSSMVQGEGASLLVRAFVDSGNPKYLEAAKKACTFMLVDKDNGGTADYEDDCIILLEGTTVPMILNGAIYSLFGLYDLWLATRDKHIKEQFDKSVLGIKRMLPRFDTGYWSYYCLDKRIASPFYHQLHITQLELLTKLLHDDYYNEMATKFRAYYSNKTYYAFAFLRKAFQKITEKSTSIAIIE